MPKTVFPQITEDAIAAMESAANPRIREVMSIVIRHLHDAVREAEPSEAEWAEAIGFLTQTGQTCDQSRQEFILLSDVLGVSMLIDAINHQDTGEITSSTVFGPFYAGLQPELPMGSSILKRPEPGDPLFVEGRVLGADGAPLEDALIEVWQTAPNGFYDVQDPEQPQGHLRASFRTGPDGVYSFKTVTPVSYPIPDDGPVGRLLREMGRHPNRPAHIHFMISAAQHHRLVTHLFTAGSPFLDSDAVFGVKPELVVGPRAGPDGPVLHYDFRLGGVQ